MSELAIVENDVETGIVRMDVDAQDQRASDELELASRLSQRIVKIVKSANLAVKLGTGEHLKLEAWLTLARWRNLVVDVEWTRYEVRDGVSGYVARARLLDSNDHAVSHAEAECWDDEKNWQNKDRFQLCSMAQTRAVSKACRNALSDIVILAGVHGGDYSTTPAEEMTGEETSAPAKPRRQAAPKPTVVAETPPPVSQPQSAPQRSSGGGSPYRQLMEYIEELGLDKNTLHRVAKEVNGSGKITDYDDEQIQQTKVALDATAGLEAPDEDADAMPF